MKASTSPAGLVLLALALAVVPAPASPAAPLTPAAATTSESAPRSAATVAKLPDLTHTAIGAVIEANDGKIPANGEELQKALAKIGNFPQLSFPFSAVALDSGMMHPRIVIAPELTASIEVIPFTPPGGWRGSTGKTGKPQIVSVPIPTGETNKQNLEGRLFLAANMDSGVRGGFPPVYPTIRTLEFISWNRRRMKFDFGVIEDMGSGSPHLKLLDGTRCFSCHKTRGPILGVGPWSNSIHNDVVRTASLQLFPGADEQSLADGMMMFHSGGPEVEETVRAGADLLRNREIFRALTKTDGGRKTLTMMLVALVDSESLDKLDTKLKKEFKNPDLLRFMADAVAIQKATPSSFLADFSPAGSMGKVNGKRITWGGSLDAVCLYDIEREAGQHGIPSEHLPSNPKAFLTPPLTSSKNPGDHLSIVKLARTLGITDGDRTFLFESSQSLAEMLEKSDVTASSLARDVFTGPTFADVMAGGPLPDRDEFKDRFVAGLRALLADRPYLAALAAKRPFWHLPDRETYTSSPLIKRWKEEPEPELTPTTACLRCHDIHPAGKAATFSQIPLLAFDPFDTTARESWVKTADRKQKTAVLTRLLKRLDRDKDMPPEDSEEAALFRKKDPAAFDSVRDWLEAELKKAKAR